MGSPDHHVAGVIAPAPLPARWGVAQRLKNTLLYGLIRACFAAWRRIPLFVLRRWAGLMAPLAKWLAFGPTAVARRNLQRAFPQLDPPQRERVLTGMYRHLGLSAAELAHLSSARRRVVFAPGAAQVFEAALARGKGAVVVTGHIGNWELLAQVVSARYPVTTVAKPLYDPRLTRWVHRLRTGGDLQIIWRHRRHPTATALQMRRALKQGRLLALLIDQHTRVPSVPVAFLGHPAPTPVAPAALALRSGAPALVCWIHRQGKRHVIHARELESPSPDLPSEQAQAALLAQANQCLSEAIAAHPEQWVWMHRRW